MEYFRLNNKSHSTLVLNGHLQDPHGQTTITKVNFKEGTPFLILDLSKAYSEDARSVHRGIRLMVDNGALIQDEITGMSEPEERNVRWQMTTDAQISIHGNAAMLSREGRSLHAPILSPARALFQIAPAITAPPKRPNPGFRQLVIQVGHAPADTRITVLLSLTETKIEDLPLSSW